MMGARLALLVATASVVLLGSCSSEPPRCTPGLSHVCACEDGAIGAQSCRLDGSYDPCDCASGCRPGDRSLCLCDDGASGTQLCVADGTYEPCTCVARCVPGSTNACVCASGRMGSQSCRGDGSYEACVCRESCVHGESQACTCAGGTASRQVCAGDRFGACECETTPDAGSFDGGTEPSCASCGCAPPPTGPRITDPLPLGSVATIAGGREVFVLRDGYVVRTDDAILLVGRDGARLHRLESVVLDMDVVGERVYYRTEEQLVALDGSLLESGHARLRTPCEHMVALECDRVLCIGWDASSQLASVYDLASDAVTVTTSLVSPPTALVRLAGRDTVVDRAAWRRIDARGVVRGYLGPFSSLEAMAAIGWPAHTVVTQEGMLHDARGCGAPSFVDGPLPPGCGDPLGPLGLPDVDEAIGWLVASPAGWLVAVTAGARGASVVTMDVTTRSVLARVPLPPLRISLDGLAHDVRLGRHVIWGRTCETCALEILTIDDGLP